MNAARGVVNRGEGEVILGDESLGKGDYEVTAGQGKVTLSMRAGWRWDGTKGKPLLLRCAEGDYPITLPLKGALSYRDIRGSVKQYRYNRDSGKVDIVNESCIIRTDLQMRFHLKQEQSTELEE